MTILLDFNLHLSQWLLYSRIFPLPQQNQHHPWSVTEQMQDNIDSICHKTICTNPCRSCKFVRERSSRRSYCHTDKKLQEKQSLKYTKCTHTRDSRMVLKASFFNWLCAERPSIWMLNMNSIVLKNVNLVGKQNKVTRLSSGPVRETKQGFVPFYNNNLNLIKSQQMPHRLIQRVYCCWISSCGWAVDYWVGGQGSRPRPDPQSGS